MPTNILAIFSRSIVFVLTVAALGLSMISCGYKNPDPDSGAAVPQKSNAIGPFQIAFTAAGDYEQTFDAQISQAAGKVEYFIEPIEARRFQVTASQATAYGCDGKSANHTLFWLPDSAQTTGQYLWTGSMAATDATKRGLLLVIFDNLAPCNRLVFSLKLKKIDTLAVDGLPGPLQN